MLRTYLYIPDELNKKIEKASKENGKSKAEVIRTTLEKGFKRDSKASKKLRSQEYMKKLLTIKGDWFDYKEYKRNRRQLDEQINKRAL